MQVENEQCGFRPVEPAHCCMVVETNQNSLNAQTTINHDEQKGGQIDKNVQIERQKDRKIEGWKDRRIERQKDRKIEGQKDRRIERQKDRKMEGRKDRYIDRQIDDRGQSYCVLNNLKLDKSR